MDCYRTNTFAKATLVSAFLIASFAVTHASCYIGVNPKRTQSTDQASLDLAEASFGREAAFQRVYASFAGTDGPERRMEVATNNNMRIQYRFNPVSSSGNQSRVYKDIKNGVYDTELTAHVDVVIDWIKANDNKWVRFSFADEMNTEGKDHRVTDFGTANGPENFKAAWIHLWNLVRDRCVARDLSPSKIKFSFEPSRRIYSADAPAYWDLAAIYPGNQYVNYAACHIYNPQRAWKNHFPVGNIIDKYTEIGADVKPFGFGEIGIERQVEPSDTGNRAVWINKHFTASSFSARNAVFFNYFDRDVFEEGEMKQWALGDAASDAAISTQLADPFFIAGE